MFLWTFLRPDKIETHSRPLMQGDKMGRIFAFWAIVFFGQCFLKNKKVAHILGLIFF
jgi:hypothetical protein